VGAKDRCDVRLAYTLAPVSEYDNDPCAAAMRPYIKLLLPLVTFVTAFVYTDIQHVTNGDKNAPVRALI